MLHELVIRLAGNRRSITFVLLGGFAWILLNLSAQTTVWHHADFSIVFQDPSTDCLPLLFPGGRFILPLINNRLSQYTNIETTLRRRSRASHSHTMADSLGPPPPGGDATRAPTMIGVFGAMTLLSILCAAARIYTRVRLLRLPGMDDAVIVFTIVGVLHLKQASLNAYLLSY